MTVQPINDITRRAAGTRPQMQDTKLTSPYAVVPDNAHTDIPGNPSIAMSSKVKINDRSNGEALRALSEEDWAFWKHNGYIVG